MATGRAAARTGILLATVLGAWACIGGCSADGDSGMGGAAPVHSTTLRSGLTASAAASQRFAALARAHQVHNIERDLAGAPLRKEARPVIAPGLAASFEPIAARPGHVRAVLADADRKVRRPALVDLPLVASDPVRVVDEVSGMGVSFQLRGARASGVQVADGLALYAGATADAMDVIQRPTAEGVEDFIVFERAPEDEVVRYDVDVREADGLRLVGNVVELIRDGVPPLRVAPPWIVGADHERRMATLTIEGCAYDVDPNVMRKRTAVAPGAPTCTVAVSWAPEKRFGCARKDGSDDCAKVVYPAVLDPYWSTTYSMATARKYFAVSVLDSGFGVSTCAIGGNTGSASTALTECSMDNGGWSPSGTMATAREGHVAIQAGTLNAMVAGGLTAGSPAVMLASAEKLVGGTWSSAGTLPGGARRDLRIALLPSGKVLVSGGFPTSGASDIYTPSSNTWAAGAALVVARCCHTLTALADGRLLATGGWDGAAALSSAEVFTENGSWSKLSGTLPHGAFRHSAVLLGTKVIIAGGTNLISGTRSIYTDVTSFDQATNAFTVKAPMPTGREMFSLFNLSGRIIAAGGRTSDTTVIANAELYDSTTNVWTAIDPMTTARYLASDSGGWVMGGADASAPLKSVEAFALRANGSTCSTGTAYLCASGNCVDGYCCNTACSGGCDICNKPGALGTCSLLADGATGVGCGNFLCNGTSGSCPTTCAGDVDCDSGYYCNPSSNCVAKKTTGSTCNAAAGADCKVAGCAVCSSGNCVDGYCCNTACSGACDICNKSGALGTCSIVSDGTVSANPSCGAYLCNGTIPTCPTTCAADADCATGYYCGAAGTCLAQKANGTTCNTAAGADCKVAGCRECTSGNCVDGYCCNTTCTASCDVCNKSGSLGTCSVAADGAVGSPSCGAYLCNGTATTCPTTCAADADCATGYYCGAAGTCLAQKANGTTCNTAAGADCKVAGCRECTSGNCVDGYCCNTACNQSCDVCSAALGSSANGTCGNATKGYAGNPACTTVLCPGGQATCGTLCDSDQMCASGYYCNAAGNCVARKATGVACNDAAGADCKVADCRVCTSGNCVDGYCCNSACSGECDVCSVALGSTANGTCSPAPASTACSGGAYCSPPSTTCPSTCTSDGNCSAGYFCNALGKCQAKKSNGQTCNTAAGADCMVAGCAECTSGNCVDGYCCNSTCTAACASCSVVPGTCTAEVFGASGTCGVYVCNGTSTTCPTSCTSNASCASGSACIGGTCQAPLGLGSLCALDSSCASGFCVDSVCCNSACAGACDACNAAGTCQNVTGPGTPSCGAYVCSGTQAGCPTSCTSNANCSAGYYCNAGACVLKLDQGSPCGADGDCNSGHCVESVCCDSVCNGTCQTCLASNQAPGGTDGTCGLVKAGADPRGACADDGATSCGKDGTCDGNGACALYAAGTSCKANTCAGDAANGYGFSVWTCNGVGACADVQTPCPVTDGCVAGACRSTCTVDGDCSAAAYCQSGACTARKAVGMTCAGANECAQGACVEGVCCDSACSGACRTCLAANQAPGGADGICGPVAAGQDPRSSCDPDGTACGLDGTCDGAGACRKTPAGTSCGPSICLDNSVAGQVCDGTGTCVAVPGGMTCTPYACVVDACLSSCAVDTDCAPDGYYCAGSACKAKGADSTVCAGDKECLSGHCADGFCCDLACTGVCESCAGANSDNGKNGQCGGAKAGVPAKQATSCSGESRVDYVCDGTGSVSANLVPCAPLSCAAGACLPSCTTATDCASGYYCDVTQSTCLPKDDNGATCTGAATCKSGFCVDGVCCDQACSGQCQACDVATAKGTCSPVVGPAHTAGGLRAACPAATGGDLCTERTCDGSKDIASCVAFVGAGVSCRQHSCVKGVETFAASCDGSGACPAATTKECTPYVCQGDACGAAACATDADCADQFQCDPAGHTCVAKVGALCDGDHTLKVPGQPDKDCSPYRCSGSVCNDKCTSVDDCVEPNVCDSNGKCEPAPKSTDEGSCACRTVGAGGPTPAGILAIAAAALALARRRRAGRRA